MHRSGNFLVHVHVIDKINNPSAYISRSTPERQEFYTIFYRALHNFFTKDRYFSLTNQITAFDKQLGKCPCDTYYNEHHWCQTLSTVRFRVVTYSECKGTGSYSLQHIIYWLHICKVSPGGI